MSDTDRKVFNTIGSICCCNKKLRAAGAAMIFLLGCAPKEPSVGTTSDQTATTSVSRKTAVQPLHVAVDIAVDVRDYTIMDSRILTTLTGMATLRFEGTYRAASNIYYRFRPEGVTASNGEPYYVAEAPNLKDGQTVLRAKLFYEQPRKDDLPPAQDTIVFLVEIMDGMITRHKIDHLSMQTVGLYVDEEAIAVKGGRMVFVIRSRLYQNEKWLALMPAKDGTYKSMRSARLIKTDSLV